VRGASQRAQPAPGSLVLGAIALVLALLGPALAASPAVAAGGCEEHGGIGCGLSGQYSGSWEAERIDVKGPKLTVTTKIKLAWSEHFDGQYWVLSSDSGSFSCSGSGEYAEGACRGSTNPNLTSCTGALSLASGGAAAFRQAQMEHAGMAGVGGFGTEPFISHEDPSNAVPHSPGVWYVSLAPPLRSTLIVRGSSYEELLHSSDTEAGSPCASSLSERKLDATWTVPSGQWATGLGGAGCHYEGGDVVIDWLSFPAGSSHTATDDCSGSGTEGTTTGKATLQQSVTFSSPGAGSGSPGGGTPRPAYGPEFRLAKREAFRDMREEAIPNAAHYCLPAAGALGLGGAGVLTLGLGPAGGILAVAGSVTASTLGPFCTATVTRLAKDYKGYKDPPLWSIHVLARPAAGAVSSLPACTPNAEPIASFCNALRAADTGLLGAARRTAEIATAVEQTISREHAAHGAGNSAAIAAQDANLRTLKRERSAANAAERSAGISVARVLKGAGIGFRINRRQSARVIALAEREARRQRITPANLRAVNRAALKPAAANLLADLERL
jgi:hypothetical protein